mgnify:CR=1 FL=1
MEDTILFIVSYFIGVLVAYLVFQPMKNWEEGYKVAKERYNDWNLGFNEGYKAAEKLFQDYVRGFGDGFEAGWDEALKGLKQEGE